MSQDWTWVLDRRCDQCGLRTAEIDRRDLAARFRVAGGAWRELLGRGPGIARNPEGAHGRTWSLVEYGCHVRDLCELTERRLRLMLKKRKSPSLGNWDHEQAAIDGEYLTAEPAKVAYAAASAAGRVADLLDRVDGQDWSKSGTRSDGVIFTVESLSRYMLHDVEHHLWDAHEILEDR